MSSPKGYRAHLDGVRAIAVTMVVLFHLGYRWIPGGFVGVDVFFVMSGYLITGLLLAEATTHRRVRFGRFYARRMRRLLPASALVLITVMIVSYYLVDLLARQSIGHDATAAALYVANWRFAAADVGYFTPGDVPSPIVHFWSLAVEEQFYLVWPAAFALLWKAAIRGRQVPSTRILLAGIGIVGVASAVASVVLVPSTLAYYGTHTRAYQLLAGAALAVVADRVLTTPREGTTARRVGTAGVIVSLAALVALGYFIDNAVSYPGWNGLAVTAASVVLIAALDLAPLGLAQRILGLKPIAGLGRLSYSLYLWHWPVIVFAPLLATKWHTGWIRNDLAMVVAMFAFASVSYLAVERPIRFRLQPKLAYRWVVATGLVVSVAVSVVGIPFLQPADAYQASTLAAVRDNAAAGPCPYFKEQWGATSTAEPCVYRKGGPFVVALVGDSHAQQWQPAFEAIADKYDLTIIRVTRRGCPANDITVFSVDDQGRPHADLACTEWRHRLYAALVDDYDPDLIYVETRSHEWGIRTADRDVPVTDPDHVRLWADAWKPSLKVLTRGSGMVVVGHTTPNMPWRVPACLASHEKGTDKCDMPLSDDPEVAIYNRAFDKIAATIPGVTVVDTTPIICPDGLCPAVIDGTIVHRDDDHVSATFARDQAGRFEDMLLAAGVRFPER